MIPAIGEKSSGFTLTEGLLVNLDRDSLKSIIPIVMWIGAR